MVKNPPTMQKTWVRSLRQEDPLEKEMATHSSILAGESHGQRSLAGYIPWGLKSRTQLSEFHFQFLGFPSGSAGKESACNAGDLGLIPGSGRSPGEGNGNPLQYLAWRIPWTGKPGGLSSIGSQRVGHD